MGAIPLAGSGGVDTALDLASPRLRALRRLADSRSALAAAWQPPADTPQRAGRGHGSRWWRLVRRQLGAWPVLSDTLRMLDRAWRAHPWQPAVHLLAGEAQDRVAPWVRRHPLAAVAVAAGTAAALVTLRPWRWPLVAQACRPLPARWSRWALEQVAQLPVSALLAGWLAAHPPASTSNPDREGAHRDEA